MRTVGVLVSLARHPKSGRLMLSPNDARAAAIAKCMASEPRLIHVGRPEEQLVLRQYLGLGFPSLDLIEAPNDADVCAVLSNFMTKNPVDFILTGLRAMGQDDTGLVPYVLADSLGLPLIDRVLEFNPKTQIVQQFLPRGRRRELVLPNNAIVTASDHANLDLVYVARWANQGEIRIHQGVEMQVKQVTSVDWIHESRKPGRERLSIKSDVSGWDRLARRMNTAGAGGELITDDSDRGATRVIEILKEKKLISSAS